MSRLRLPRPSPRRLSAALAVLGVAAGLACLLLPVEAAFGDDPLLQLHSFSPALSSAPTDVDCGRPVSNLARRSEGVGLYDVAFADACRDAAGRRAATGVAAVAVIGLLALVGASGRPEPTMAA